MPVKSFQRQRTEVFLTAVFWICISCQTLLAVNPWPGEAWNVASNLTSLGPAQWSGNLSSAYWNPLTRRLWLANNWGVYTVLKENGKGGFTNEHNFFPGYPNDLEGITQTSDTNHVYLMIERANIIREYMVSSGATNQSWNLTSLVGDVGSDANPYDGNDGTEGIAFIPDSWLAASGFCDSNGLAYTQSAYGSNGLGGIMLVGVQHFTTNTTGYIYAVDLNTNGQWTTVGKYKTASRGDSCDLSFDSSIGRLYILHNSDEVSPQVNIVEVTDLTSSPYGADRKFTTLNEFEIPSTKNIEGFAVTPALTSSNTLGNGWCFLANDDGGGDALRWFKQLHSTISINSGDNQSAPISTDIPIQPSVLVQDAFHNPLPAFAVTFAIASGNGSNTGDSATTDINGIATVGSWTLGTNFGPNTLSGTGAGLTGSPVIFLAAGTDPTRTNTLFISCPAYGLAIPSSGLYSNQAWTLFSATVTSSPVSGGMGTQCVCRGWTGSGSVPAGGITNNTGLQYLTNDTTITWLWATNYWLSVLTNGYGTVTGTRGWINASSNTTLYATTNLFACFAGWSGDIGPANTGDVAYAVTMDRPRTLTANFTEFLAASGTPWHWLAQYYPATNDFDSAEVSDTDGDTMHAWEEYKAGTDPTNRLSRLKILSTLTTTNAYNIYWSSVTGKTYSVYMSTSLVEGWLAEPLTTSVPSDLSGTTSFKCNAITNAPVFYRISVE